MNPDPKFLQELAALEKSWHTFDILSCAKNSSLIPVGKLLRLFAGIWVALVVPLHLYLFTSIIQGIFARKYVNQVVYFGLKTMFKKNPLDHSPKRPHEKNTTSSRFSRVFFLPVAMSFVYSISQSMGNIDSSKCCFIRRILENQFNVHDMRFRANSTIGGFEGPPV